MFRMLTCFNLKPGVSVDEFSRSLDSFNEHLLEKGLVHSTGPIGRRQRHPIMDTDDERDHEYFFIMSFEDREHCDRAVAVFQQHDAPGQGIHRATYAMVRDPVFICWEDI